MSQKINFITFKEIIFKERHLHFTHKKIYKVILLGAK